METAERTRVLIVDDGAGSGAQIKELIRWGALELECLDIARDGPAALEIIRESRPDIVITDIQTAGTDGLELIRRTGELGGETRFVIVSGCRVFEYVYRALRYGVRDYLLKPVDEDELNGVLGRIRRERLAEEEDRKMRAAFLASRRIIREKLFNDLIGGETTDGGILHGGVYRAAAVKLDRAEDAFPPDPARDRAAAEAVMSAAERLACGNVTEVLLCEKEDLYIYCLFNYQPDRAEAVRACLAKLLAELRQQLSDPGQYEVTVGLGRMTAELSQIRLSVEQARRAADNRIRLGTGRLIDWETVGPLPAELRPVRSRREAILAAVSSGSADMLGQCIDAVFEEILSQSGIDYACCYDAAAELTELIFDTLGDTTLTPRKKQLLSGIRHCGTADRLLRLLKQETADCLRSSRGGSEDKLIRPVRLAQRYIEEHYREKVTLRDISELVGLNPVYFSVLFKKEVKMNFSSYLIAARMRRARELLCGTNETIAAIGAQVGYKDPRYFSQIFERTYGMKPALYRRLYS